MGAHTTSGGLDARALPAPLAAALRQAAPAGEGLVLEVGNHSSERAGVFAAAGWAYVSLEEAASPGAVADPRHRLRGPLAEAAYLPGGSFDGVLVLDAVERMRAPWRAAAQVARILKAGGWVYVESGLRSPVEADGSAPWSFGPAALRALFAGLEERSCAVTGGGASGDGGQARVHYLGARPVRRPAGAARDPAGGGCPVCGTTALEAGEPHPAYGEPLAQCTACGHGFVRSDGPVESKPPQSRARIDFYVQHVLRHLPAGSVLDLHPAPDNQLLAAVRRHMPDARRLAVAAAPAGSDDIQVVDAPAAAGQVDVAIGLLVLPFLSPPQLARYVREVAEVARSFVFEVPAGDDPAARAAHMREGHRQFFSARSLHTLFEGTGARVHGMTGFGPRRAPVLVAYRLPGGAVLSNGLVLEP